MKQSEIDNWRVNMQSRMEELTGAIGAMLSVVFSGLFGYLFTKG